MECRTVRLRMSDLLDARLGEAEGHRVRAHLAACPACRRRSKAEEVLRAVRRTLPDDLGDCTLEELRGRLGLPLEGHVVGAPAVYRLRGEGPGMVSAGAWAAELTIEDPGE